MPAATHASLIGIHATPLATAELVLVIPSRNSGLPAIHERALSERLAALSDDGTAHRVAEGIGNLLPHGEPRRQQVAERLALTDRALQQRLQAEHTFFQQVLDETRTTLAERHLRDPRLTLRQVAHGPGFADESNFFRACRRRFGMPPGQYREHHTAASHAPDPFNQA